MSQYLLSLLKSYEKNYNEELIGLKKAADGGVVEAMLKLAAWYEFGKEEDPNVPVSKDTNLAFHFHHLAAHAHNVEALYIIGAAHAAGTHSLQKSYKTALDYFAMCLNTSKIFLSNIDSKNLMNNPEDQQKYRLLASAAFQGGLIALEGGHGLGDPNPVKAVEFWKVASSLGHAQSMFNLGVLMLNGWGMGEARGRPDVGGGIRLIKEAKKLDSKLGWPPQIGNLTEEEVDEVIKSAEIIRNNGVIEDVAQIVRVAKKRIQERSKSESASRTTTTTSTSTASHIDNAPSTAESLKKMTKKKKRKHRKHTHDDSTLTPSSILCYSGIIMTTAILGLYLWKRLSSQG